MTEKDRAALEAEKLADQEFTRAAKSLLKEQKKFCVTFDSNFEKLSELSDELIECGALEVSLDPMNLKSFALTVDMKGKSLEDSSRALENLMHSALGALPQLLECNEAENRSHPSWSYEEERVLNAVNWQKAAIQEGFPPVNVGRFQVVPVQTYYELPLRPQDSYQPSQPPRGTHQVRILPGEGWGDGHHPTTMLCLDFLSQEGIVCGGERVVDYGCGSGILSIAAVQLGAREAVGIDVCYDALASATTNVRLNGVEQEVELLHPREVVPGDFVPGDIVLANILVGTLMAMSNTILGAVREGGWLVLSGLRPEQVEVIKRKYGDHVRWDESLERAEEVENPTFGTGAGLWVRLVGRRVLGDRWVEALSEAAVS